MLLRSFKWLVVTLVAALSLLACGNGDPAPAPTGLKVTAGDTSATVTWDKVDGVEYWLFYAPTSVVPTNTTSMHGWIGLPGGNVLLKVTPPVLVSGVYNGTTLLTSLINGIPYSFSVNGRTSGGPGGPGAVAVTATPRIAGASWITGATNPPGSNDLRSVAYGATSTTTTSTTTGTITTTLTTYVAAGVAGAMYSSNDGATWNAINYATSSKLNGASYFGTYKLVGDGGVVLVSADAISWTPQTSGTSQNLYAIASNNANLNVAVGAGGTIITSPDGVSWKAAVNSATSSDLYAVTYSAYNSGTWVAVGAGGTMVESADGLTWHSVASNTLADLRGIASSTSTSSTGVVTTTLVVVGAAGTVLSSTDASTWAARVLPGAFAGTLNAVVNGGQFVTVGSGGSIFISTDGLTWAAASSTNTNDLYAVTRGLYVYSAVGAAGTNLLAR
jgi:predicted small lipoprotein YifL